MSRNTRWRHLHVVRPDRVISLRAPLSDIRTGGREERFRRLVSIKRFRDRFRIGVIVCGQPIDLVHVEDRVALHEGDSDFSILTSIVGFGLAKRVGIDNQFTLGALARLATKLRRLTIGQPGLRWYVRGPRRRPRGGGC